MDYDLSYINSYKDYSYIMYIVCDQTSSYYSKIKNTINIPIVFCSAGLSIMNTYTTKDLHTSHSIKNTGIVLNILIALSLSILNIYKITEKEFFFNTQSVKFLKIYNKINIEIMKSKTELNTENIMNIITEYNILCEHIQFHIPSHIRKYILKNYKHFQIPFLILNTVKKERKWKFLKFGSDVETTTFTTSESLSKFSNETSYNDCKSENKQTYSTVLKKAYVIEKNKDNCEILETENESTSEKSPTSEINISIIDDAYDQENMFFEDELQQDNDYHKKNHKKRKGRCKK